MALTKRPPPSIRRSRRWITWLGWLIFGAGLLSYVFLFVRHSGSSVPRVPWHSRWGQPRWVTFRDPFRQFLIDHPSDWEESAPFERFTRHQVGDLTAADTLALRHAHPTGLVVVIRYSAQSPHSTADWFKRTRSGGPLGDVFGEKILSRLPSRLAGREALEVTAEGVLADQVYHLESWFVPAGATAFRVTTGSPVSELSRAKPILRRVVSSFRFATPTHAQPGP